LGSLNAYPTGTPTVAPGTAAFAALLARIGRSDRRHGIRYFYCLGGHALAVAGYQPGPSLTTRRFPPPWSTNLLLMRSSAREAGIRRLIAGAELSGSFKPDGQIIVTPLGQAALTQLYPLPLLHK